jgi:hypothetical protein
MSSRPDEVVGRGIDVRYPSHIKLIYLQHKYYN